MRHFGSYQDFLRSIGYELDRNGFANIILEESNSQVVIFHLADSNGIVQYLQYTPAKMRQLLQDAHARRGQGLRPGKPKHSYEDLLRAIGFRLGDEGYRRITIVQAGTSFIVRENISLAQPRMFIVPARGMARISKQMRSLRSG